MAAAKYSLAKSGEFVIENYNSAPTFSSFFPGIAGIFGCPMWVFYANRGQCITSMGVQDKDGALLEFQSANKAYRVVSLQGFRTFLKVNGQFYEPFSEHSPYPKTMRISPAGLILAEENSKLKIKVGVEYFTVPNEPFPALARIVEITNLSKQKQKIEILDGLPTIIPSGFSNDLLKKICQTTEAWGLVENLESGAPFYRLKVVPSDVVQTRPNEKGHFFLSFASQDGKILPVNCIVNPSCVFGPNSSLEIPLAFTGSKTYHCPAHQQTEGCLPSAFAYKKLELKAKSAAKICSLFGQAESIDALNKITKTASSEQFFIQKSTENRRLIADICKTVETKSSSRAFDLYAQQTFLDNVMRGGLPVKVSNKIVYVYYRKHGDMERDYNDFKLMPAYFSQGNGNYRDINQNRRNDVFINSAVAEENIVRFFNLIQLDGFNPLVVLGSQFRIKSAAEAEAILKKHIQSPVPELVGKLTNPYTLGYILKDFEQKGIKYLTNAQAFAADLMDHSTMHDDAQHGEGFWIDHFSYNTDLLESFECLYPDKLPELLFDKPVFSFFDNEHVVVGRGEKYFQPNGVIRQYESVRFDPAKAALINSRAHGKNLVRDNFGKGNVYKTTLISKILCLIANKAAAFDAEGIGLEMEADKPDWYDALNGLPGLFGSSLSETLELKRLCLYATGYLTGDKMVSLPIEVKEFIDQLTGILKVKDNFEYWDKANRFKEEYREKTKFGVGGTEAVVNCKPVAVFLYAVAQKCSAGVKKCLDTYGNYYTYFVNGVADHILSPEKQIIVKQFKQTPLPLFLEGFVHALKVEKDKNIYERVKSSPLYDKQLKMYKVNASLKDVSLEIGRARVFAPGWLENESIWLHMEYKYLLELLKAGMHTEFFNEFRTVLIPFLDPKVYKRSVLENSSFIASSAYPNKEQHGRGFYARLSGASAEFIDMWLIMTCGKKIFSLDEKGKLVFRLSPVLPGWLFDKKGEFSFKLLGAIEVTYINQKKQNTYDKNGVKIVSYELIQPAGEKIMISSAVIPEATALLIREGKIQKITANLA
ncbi:MAG: cellobiose phosphorylase [Candidatus Margulisbacteria bacterium]|nr:cellobiose phosphorylase [Candidatus Margulisiibacteriota bacterium]